jgi:hypothetical protein
VNAADALTLAHAAGVGVRTDDDDLLLESSTPPPAAVLDLLSRHKTEIMAMLRSPAPELPRAADPTPPQRSLANPSTRDRAARADARQAALVGGLHVAARARPPSWADPTALPPRGCFCTCCTGQRWWRECEAPKGWRCSTCHPPDHLPQDAVTEMRT